MPLRCLGPDGQPIQSFDLTAAEWAALRLDSSRSLRLRMPCCNAPVVMKTSARGMNFFAHRSRGPCQSAPETEDHLALHSRRRSRWRQRRKGRHADANRTGRRWPAGRARSPIRIEEDQTVGLGREEGRQEGGQCVEASRTAPSPLGGNRRRSDSARPIPPHARTENRSNAVNVCKRGSTS